ncbi:MAG: acyl-CoA synthetase FdrA [Betaproteobacteria bacterium]
MSVVLNRIRRGYYADSVALMRVSRGVAALAGVEAASLMIGTPSNKALLRESGLLAKDGEGAKPDDLVIAVRAKTAAGATAAVEEAGRLLEARPARGGVEGFPRSRGFAAAAAAIPQANLALISVPGAFAAAEARRALESGLHVMMFSDNVPVADEVALKRLALAKDLLMMGPDCGTSIIGGAPLAFANAVPRGDVGIVSASGTGLQEVSSLLARAGRGVSQAVGVGGRDLSDEVGGLTSLAALDALDADPATHHIVIISKPPSARVAKKLLARVARSRKPVTLCLLGARNPGFAPTLLAAAERAAGKRIRAVRKTPVAPRKGWIRGLFCGGTLCAEAQLVLQEAGLEVRSNSPVPGARQANGKAAGHVLLDLGDDEYTQGRPHPMIDPELRNQMLGEAMADPGVGVVLLDVVIGYGAHADPAGLVAGELRRARRSGALVIASVTGTEDDPQVYSRQVARLREAGVLVAGSNAEAAEAAAAAAASRAPTSATRRAGSRRPSGTRRSAAAPRGRSGASRRRRR